MIVQLKVLSRQASGPDACTKDHGGEGRQEAEANDQSRTLVWVVGRRVDKRHLGARLQISNPKPYFAQRSSVWLGIGEQLKGSLRRKEEETTKGKVSRDAYISFSGRSAESNNMDTKWSPIPS